MKVFISLIIICVSSMAWAQLISVKTLNEQKLGPFLPNYPINELEKDLLRRTVDPADASAPLNSVVGTPNVETQKAVNYIQSVIDKILAVRNNPDNVKVILSIYPSKNTFFTSQKLKPEEDGWKRQNIVIPEIQGKTVENRVWPIRRFLKLGPKTQIYEIMVSTHFLNKLQTEDQLAFFIARELNNIREVVLSDKSGGYGFLSSQILSTVSDIEAISLIKKAGYDYTQAISALDLLYPKEPEKEIYPVLEGIKGDAHEGIRYATSLAYLEDLARENKNNLVAIKPTPISHDVFLNRHDRSEEKLKEKDFIFLRKNILELVEKEFSQKSPAEYFFTIGFDASLKKASVDQLGSLLMASIEAIEKNSYSKQTKGDMFFRTLRLFYPERSVSLSLPYLSLADKTRITFFLKSLSVGEDRWQFAQFMRNIQMDLVPEKEGVSNVGYNPLLVFAAQSLEKDLQDIFIKLYTDQEYGALLKNIPEIVEKFTDNSSSLIPAARLAYRLHSEYFSNHSLTQKYIENTWNILESYNLVKEVKGPEGKRIVSLFKDITTDEEKQYHPQIKERIAGLLENLRAEYRIYFNQRIEKQLEKGVTAQTSQSLLSEYQLYDEDIKFNQENKENIKKLIIISAQKSLIDSQWVPESFSFFDIFQESTVRLLTDILNASSYASETKLQIIEFVLLSKNSYSSYQLSNPVIKELMEAIQDQIKKMSSADIINWMKRPIRKQYHERFIAMLEQVYNVSIGLSESDFDKWIARYPQYSLIEKRSHLSLPEQISAPGQRLFNEWSRMSVDYKDIASYIVEIPFNRNVNILSFLGGTPEFSNSFIQKLTLRDFEDILNAIDLLRSDAKKYYAAFYDVLNPNRIKNVEKELALDNISGRFLMNAFAQVESKITTLDDWYNIYSRVRDFSPIGSRENWEALNLAGKGLVPRLQKLSPEELLVWLKKDNVMDIIDADNLPKLLRTLLPSTIVPGASPETVAAAMTSINKELELEQKYHAAYQTLMQNIAEEIKTQPGQSKASFPDVSQTNGQRVKSQGTKTRGLTGLVSLTRQQTVSDQIHLIEYMMGRRSDMPFFISEYTGDMEDITDLTAYVRETRESLARQEAIPRALFVASFLAGPSGFMNTAIGQNEMVDYLLRGISPENEEVAREIANALINSEGSSKALGIAYVLGQKVESGLDGKISEARMLKAVFEAYGVPGIKFGQYLAFTSELTQFKSVLEELQDSASPLTYLQAIQLCEERWGSNWLTHIEITKIMGSGSVNVALKYIDHKTNQSGVLSISRNNIENSSRYDFTRFRKFAQELTKDPKGMKRYGYLLGLSEIIEQSVNLEFDKDAALKMQNFVVPLYDRIKEGWHVRSISAYEAQNLTLFMEEAKGKSSRKINTLDPESYKSAMKALSSVEMDFLMGIKDNSHPSPLGLFANPDFHDGQVLIDVENKTVTILDFGQAVYINNRERDLGLKILRIISKVESAESAAKLLNRSLLGNSGQVILATDLVDLLQSTERMDIFIKLLSKLNQNKMSVPIASVHWILAVNRQIALGEKIGIDNMSAFKKLIITDKAMLGSPWSQTVYNNFKVGTRLLKNYWGQIKSKCNEWFITLHHQR